MRSHLRTTLPALLGALFLIVGCNENTPDDTDADRMLVAKQIESQRELIGGPSARGKVGDFLIRNDQVRFIVAGKGQAWMGGVFGGTLLDADLVRPEWETQYGHGHDAFSEAFPLVNLIETNPNLPGRKIAFTDDGLSLVAVPSGIEVIKDGSDGEEAWVRVSGRAGYIFEMLKFLNKDFLMSFLMTPIEFGGMELPIDKLLDLVLNVNVYALINRLQVDFRFTNDYILHPRERYLTIRTTVVTAPPSEETMTRCPKIDECKLTCDNGFALQEMAFDLTDPGAACDPAAAGLCGLVMCPACECAGEAQAMISLNESEDIFQVMLGDIGPWRDPAWKGGILGGDFIFMGNETNIFAPGFGYDETRKIFENMWQSVPSLGSPMMFPWFAATADNVSYGLATVNPDRREGVACPTWRIALTAADFEDEDALVEVLETKLGYLAASAAAKARQLIVDRRPVVLATGIPTGVDSDAELDDWKAEVLANATLQGVAPAPDSPDDPEATVPTEYALEGLFPERVDVELVEALECHSSKLVIPLFSTGATAVMTHKSPASMQLVDGVALDTNRIFTFERYFVVGEGDVGSVLETIYEIRGEATGRIKGVVVTEGTLAPIHHASVFALLDPRGVRGVPTDRKYKTYDALRADLNVAFANDGFVSEMETDVGLDPVVDGNFKGPLLPGSYFLVAFSKTHGTSSPVPVEIEEGRTAVAHITLSPRGSVDYVVTSQDGKPIPCRITMTPLDANGEPMDWDGLARVEMGGKRYDHGILVSEHSASGQGTIELPAGDYAVWVSRGFEYSVEHLPKVTVKAGEALPLQVALVREIDTTGWISGDFHVHCRPSIDSGLPMDTRVIANAAEGVEFIVSTDHDHLTWYQPWVNDLDLQSYMKTAVGVETTTLEFGHFNGFPMEYHDTDLPVHDAPPWYGYPLQEVWSMMRDRVQNGFTRNEFVVQVNHPRDGMMGYLAQFGLQGYNLQRSTPGMSMCNPQTERISCEFDSMEIMNEKRFELLRTPTIGEITRFNTCKQAILENLAPARLAFDADAAEDSICGALQAPPHDDCDTIEDAAITTTLTGMARARLFSRRDHCRWHAEFRTGMTEAAQMSSSLAAKRHALDALHFMGVRYQIERLPEEQAAFFATTTATDLGCDGEAAMKGCGPMTNDQGVHQGDCDGCSCNDCVCAALPGCCVDEGVEDEETGLTGTGWTQACADLCAAGCHGCGLQPCTSLSQSWDDWFSFLNAGFDVTAMGNSDSHETLKEVGLPRNYIPSKTDDPSLIDDREIYRNIHEGRVIISTGPFAEFTIDGAGVGDTLTASGDKLHAKVRIQTASWFGVDHIEIHRNAKLERIVRIDPDKKAIVDFDGTFVLDRPDEDSWYVLVAYGLDKDYILAPVYKRAPYGHLLIPTIIAMGGESIILSFAGLLDEIGPILDGLGMSIDSLLASLIGGAVNPDVFPMFPLVVTNPIRVMVDGDGVFTPVNGVDADGDGTWDDPPFCSRACTVDSKTDEDGNPVWGAATCGENQVCVPDTEGSDEGTCVIPIPENCVGAQV